MSAPLGKVLMACLFSRKRWQCTPRKKTADFAGCGAAFQLLRSLPLLRTNPACLDPCGVKTDLRRAGLQGTDQPGPLSSFHLVVSSAGTEPGALDKTTELKVSAISLVI